METGAQARLFVALMLGEELGRNLARAVGRVLSSEDRPARELFRLPRPEGLHATLFFLGDVERSLVADLRAALERAAVSGETSDQRSNGPWRAPALCLGRGGAFPKRGHERVLWAAVEGQELEGLWRGTLAAVGAIGVDVARELERGFRPHVTVARPRAGTRVPASFYEWAAELDWRPTEIAIVESVRVSSEGRAEPPRYRPLERIRLHVD